VRAGRELRMASRAGTCKQANLAIVPERFAFDFLRFCQRNPKPCPLLEVTDPGEPEAKRSGSGQ
jgi:uncharacterized protein YcsI (UPF0317 family)